ncbi:MAG TPA: SMP-30/gluconolactonase/LRE family protein [Rhizomicrobium sp.]|nr:SMP-30/gluconolactonase/LRE family protein [Rhizomicrobium sp.]
MKVSDFKLTRKDFGVFGAGLERPECVWPDHDGVWVSDARGGLCCIAPDGRTRLLGSGIVEANGFSRRPDGGFVVAGIGDGGLHLIAPDGRTRALLDRIEGKSLGAVNYACADGDDRIWLSVMTRALPWSAALTSKKIDGYILRVDGNGARHEIVADGLDLTNEVKLSPDRRHLYAVETLGSRILRYPIRSDGSLGPREIVAHLDRGVYPDGITFDPFGNLWFTVINQNGLSVIDRRGDVHMVFRDMIEGAVEAMVQGVEQRNGTVEQLVACNVADGPLQLPTSLAFGGADKRTVYVGTVVLSNLATFRLPERLE